jgi:hypothetical protein
MEEKEKVQIVVGKSPRTTVFVMDGGRPVNIHQSPLAIKLARASEQGRTVTTFEVPDGTTLLLSSPDGLDLYFVVDRRAPGIQVMGGTLVGSLRPSFYRTGPT